MHGITAMCWSPDSSCVVLGAISGGVMLYSTCLKRQLYKDNFEIIYSSLSKATVHHRSTGKYYF